MSLLPWDTLMGYMSVFSVKLANESLRLYLETTVYLGLATYVNHLGA